MRFVKVVLLFFSLLIYSCNSGETKTGLDALEEYEHLFENKRVGIVTNHTAYNSKGEHIIDLFLEIPDVSVTALFGPEHGIRGNVEAGKKIEYENDSIRNIPIYSLYGKTRKPSPEILENVDVLVYDIQNIGTRYYTYIYNMSLVMEAAAENDKSLVVPDRPNPINGIQIEGNILEHQFATYVGLFPIPVRHGMTIGELATMFNEEGWLKNSVEADLTVIPLKNWRRHQWFDETGLRFIKPSPNIPNVETATVYPGLCLLEGTNVSEGRGTETPFLVFGAPWIDALKLTQKLNMLNLPGVQFKSTSFTPLSIPGAALHPKYENKQCFGAKMVITDRDRIESYWTGIKIVDTISQLYPDSLKWHEKHFDRLCGSDKVRKRILAGDIDSLRIHWQEGLNEFSKIREKYLLY